MGNEHSSSSFALKCSSKNNMTSLWWEIFLSFTGHLFGFSQLHLLFNTNAYKCFFLLCQLSAYTRVFDLLLNYVVLYINVYEDPSCVEIHFIFFTLKVFNLIYNHFLPLKTGYQQQASAIQIVVLFTKNIFTDLKPNLKLQTLNNIAQGPFYTFL